MNELVFGEQPGATTVAEESTAWPMVSRPVYVGGLGFGYKWNMGWMHDTLSYMSRDPIHRRYHHNDLTFGLLYAFHENFILPLSHDEVVHGKGSLIGKMPGDRWQQFANLRAYFALHVDPSRQEAAVHGRRVRARSANGTTISALDWQLLDDPLHARRAAPGARPQPALSRDAGAAPARLRARRASSGSTPPTRDESVLVLSAPRPRPGRAGGRRLQFHAGRRATTTAIGVPRPGRYRERINTDARDLWRQRRRQCRRGRSRAASDARPAVFAAR